MDPSQSVLRHPDPVSTFSHTDDGLVRDVSADRGSDLSGEGGGEESVSVSVRVRGERRDWDGKGNVRMLPIPDGMSRAPMAASLIISYFTPWV